MIENENSNVNKKMQIQLYLIKTSIPFIISELQYNQMTT